LNHGSARKRDTGAQVAISTQMPGQVLVLAWTIAVFLQVNIDLKVKHAALAQCKVASPSMKIENLGNHTRASKISPLQQLVFG
jgi:hypothetical protein